MAVTPSTGLLHVISGLERKAARPLLQPKARDQFVPAGRTGEQPPAKKPAATRAASEATVQRTNTAAQDAAARKQAALADASKALNDARKLQARAPSQRTAEAAAVRPERAESAPARPETADRANSREAPDIRARARDTRPGQLFDLRV